MSYKIYINKDSKPVIRRVDEKHIISNSVVSRILALTLCITTGLILGMRRPDFSIAQPDIEVEPQSYSDTAGFDVSTLMPPPDLSIVNNETSTANEENESVPEPDSAANPTVSIANEEYASSHENDAARETVTIRSGDNLSLIFDRMHISRQDLDRIMSLGKETAVLKNLMPNHTLHLQYAGPQLDALEYEINLTDTIQVSRLDTGFSARTITTELETQTSQASGTITDSLFLSAQRSGLSDNLIMQLIEIFGWDIDFALDIREGDSFLILYEEKFKNGVKVQDGPILAAEFINQDKPFYAVRYTGADGHTSYFNEEGFGMRKAFLRTPVNFTRISSGFSLARKHPILNRIRAHKGVDYAAPIGTPVKATGDGIVDFSGINGGYGKMIILRHGEKYSTVYGHLARFAKKITRGKRIKQGQTIGYVGMSGLATGPHLHYEFRINGVHYNPLTVKLPKALGIPKQEMENFRSQTQPLLAQLQAIRTATVHPSANDKPVVASVKTPGASSALE